MNELQYYPTPLRVAQQAWKMFNDRDFVRVLDPSAGNGHLFEGNLSSKWRHGMEMKCDAIEMDITKHATLRSKGLHVIGIDFFDLKDASQYSHILMNPPFADGAKHVLHAWNILWNGEIVAILNAETVNNPFSRERKALLEIIQSHGRLAFIGKAFQGADVEVQADVEVVLVHLTKTADTASLVGDLLAEMKADSVTPDDLASTFHERMDVAIPTTVVENSVRAFGAAVQSMKESVMSEARASYYANILGETLAVRNTGGATKKDVGRAWVVSEIGKRYDDLRDRAWAGILRGSAVTEKLSVKAQKRVETEFAQISKLAFTESNIYGFLAGLADNQGKIFAEMACDIFDEIAHNYRDGNCTLYRGWRSNTKHWVGLKIKSTRFIIPGHRREPYHNCLDWDSERQLSDFDKVFSMMDGKQKPAYGLVQAFKTEYENLCKGARVSTDYFDIRFFPRIGTIHFFPRDKSLLDRFNRFVAKHRAWLPSSDNQGSKQFWKQYENSEKFEKEILEEISASTTSYYDRPLDKLFWKSKDPEAIREQEEATRKIDMAIASVHERHGIRVDFQLEAQPDLLRLAA